MTMLQTACFSLVAACLALYYVLGGSGLGAGMLGPVLARTEAEKRAFARALAPAWASSLVWLLAALACLFAAFPSAFSSLLSAFSLPVALAALGLLSCALALAFSLRDGRLAGFRGVLLFCGSLLPALLFGFVLGACIQGVPLDADGDFTGAFSDLLRPLPLLCALLGLVTVLMQGASWLALKIERGSRLQQRARHTRLVLQIATILLFVAVAAFYLLGHGLQLNEGAALVVQVAALAAIVVGVVAGFLAGGRGNDLFPFLAGSLVCAGLVALFSASIFPDFIVSTGTGASVSIARSQADASVLTLVCMAACVGVPLAAASHAAVHRLFRGRVALDR